MKKTLKGISKYLGVLIVGIIFIVVFKTFDNLGVILNGVKSFLGIISPFIIALGIAFLLYQPSSKLESLFKKSKKKFLNKHSRVISVLIVYAITISIIILLFIFAVPRLVDAVSGFAQSVPGYIKTLQGFLEPLFANGGFLEDFNVTTNINNAFAKYVQPRLTPEAIFSYFQNILTFTSSLLNILMALIISIYMLLSRESLIKTVKTMFSLVLPEKTVGTIGHYTRKSSEIAYTYFYSQFIDAGVVAVVMSIGCVIFGAPNPLLLGALIGATNMIPYFGAIIGGAVVVLITLLSTGPSNAIFLGIYIIVLQQLDANLIQPKIVGDTVGIQPIYVLLAITVGGGLFGFWGIFFGVPIIAIIQMLFRDYVNYRNKLKSEKETSDKDVDTSGDNSNGSEKKKTVETK